ncbi:MAG: hypothetical protein ABIJ15_07075 [bacterium]
MKMTLPSGDTHVRGLALGSLRARAKLLAHTAPADNGHFSGKFMDKEKEEVAQSRGNRDFFIYG